MIQSFTADADKNEVFEKVQQFIDEQGFSVVAKDHSRPWGGFFVLDESQAPKFISTFFPHLSLAPKSSWWRPTNDFHGNITTAAPKSGK